MNTAECASKSRASGSGSKICTVCAVAAWIQQDGTSRTYDPSKAAGKGNGREFTADAGHLADTVGGLSINKFGMIQSQAL